MHQIQFLLQIFLAQFHDYFIFVWLQNLNLNEKQHVGAKICGMCQRELNLIKGIFKANMFY